MTDQIEHPMKTAPVHVFQRIDSDGKGYGYVAMLYPYRKYPVYFHGATEASCRQSCADFVAGAVEKHEAAFIARQEAAQRARDAAKAKKEKAA